MFANRLRNCYITHQFPSLNPCHCGAMLVGEHCLLTIIFVGIIRIWSQMSSGVKPVLLWVVPVNKSALRGGIVRNECHRFLENK